LHAETALGTGRMTSTFECSKKWGDYRMAPYCQHPVTGEINMIIPLLWFGLALLLGIVASSNGRSFWGWFILGLIIDPILAGLLYWLVCRDR
ncbi:hypothetical protein ACK3ZB_12415, partial [Aeromonas caviae]